jgi:hypothetical protein
VNPEFPNSIRKTLAQQGAVIAHPSADLLTAFAEHALSAGENERIADHLARCSDCRKVAFLAGVAEEQCTAQTERAAKADSPVRPRWVRRLVPVSAIAGLAIAGGFLVQQYLTRDRSSQKPVQTAQVTVQRPPLASKPEPMGPTVVTPETTSPKHEKTAKSSSTATALRQNFEIPANASAPRDETKSLSVASVPPAAPVNQPPTSVVGGAENSFKATVPAQNTFAERPEGSQAQAFAGVPSSALPQVLLRPGTASKTWRVTPEGHLEHLSQTGWTGVLTDQPTKFGVVSEYRNSVWAGGSRGELFHSEDGGQHWSDVPLPLPPDGQNDPIVTIYFADQQHGVVMTKGSARYTTGDGGKNWERQ